MTERPRLLNGPMVRATLDGRKTQTRAPISPQPTKDEPIEFANGTRLDGWSWPIPKKDRRRIGAAALGFHSGEEDIMDQFGPFGLPGDRLWVREAWQAVHFSADFETGICDDWSPAVEIPKSDESGWWTPVYQATDPDGCDTGEDRGYGYRPSIHMPRWASRIDLDVLSVRVERVQDITEEDARAEGIGHVLGDDYPEVSRIMQASSRREAFAWLWDSLYPGSWQRNDWVWQCSFRRVEA